MLSSIVPDHCRKEAGSQGTIQESNRGVMMKVFKGARCMRSMKLEGSQGW